MGHYILTGAGFSKNFGGLLAGELWADLMKDPNICNNDELKSILAQHPNDFEGALAGAQDNSEHYKTLEEAVYRAFAKMDEKFKNPPGYLYDLEQFLKKFDTFFTTNQDLLIERQFVGLAEKLTQPGIKFDSPQFWRGCRYIDDYSGSDKIRASADRVFLEEHLQSTSKMYVKLHGAYNWYTANARMMIMGNNKVEQIDSAPLLKQYYELFKNKVSQQDNLLLTFGYSFSDDHINKVILDAMLNNGLCLYIWNPSGKDGVIKTLKDRNNYSQDIADLFDVSKNPGRVRECKEKLWLNPFINGHTDVQIIEKGHTLITQVDSDIFPGSSIRRAG